MTSIHSLDSRRRTAQRQSWTNRNNDYRMCAAINRPGPASMAETCLGRDEDCSTTFSAYADLHPKLASSLNYRVTASGPAPLIS